jgi:hypothetical protein
MDGSFLQHISGSRPQERQLYLFNDLLLIAKPKGGNLAFTSSKKNAYECKAQISLEECRFINTADTDSLFLFFFFFSLENFFL